LRESTDLVFEQSGEAQTGPILKVRSDDLDTAGEP
jgi:hypothetical protein